MSGPPHHGLIPVRAIDLLRGPSSRFCPAKPDLECAPLHAALSPVRARRLGWKPLATDGQRCGKAEWLRTQHARPRLRLHTSLPPIPSPCKNICCWPLGHVEPTGNFNAPSLRNIEAAQGKNMRNEGGPQL